MALLTPQVIAMEALAILRNQLVMADLVHTDYANEFVKVGDTITVRKPASLLAKDFAGTITTQSLNEAGVAVKLDRFKDVSVALTSKQETLELKDFSKQVIEPAMVALAQQIDEDLANYAFGIAGNTVSASSATPTNLADIANVGKALDIAKAPIMDRHLVLSPEHKYRYALTDQLSKVSYAGDNVTIREALLGKVYGLNTYLDQNVPVSTAIVSGTQTGTVKVASGSTAGEVNFTEFGLATGTMKIGDGFIYNGILYRLTEDITATSNAFAGCAVSPAFPEGVSTAVLVPIVRKANSVAFHKNAIAFVIRPLDLPMGAVRASVQNGEGLSVRVVYGYDQSTKTDTISFDVLYGIATLRAEHAVRVQDTF